MAALGRSFILLVSGIALLGRALGVSGLTRWLPGGAAMALGTSLDCLVMGAGMVVQSFGWRRLGAAGGAAVALFVVLPWRGPMATAGAAALVAVGTALVLQAGTRGPRWPFGVIAGVVLAVALIPILQLLVWLLGGAGGQAYQGMALPTAVCLTAMAIPILRQVRGGIRAEDGALPFMSAALGMLFCTGLAAAQGGSQLLAANHLVEHTYAVRGAVDRLVEEVARGESSARAFALTGEDLFRQRAGLHEKEVLARLDELDPLVADNPGQGARVRHIRELAEEKFAQSEELERLRQRAGTAAAAADYLRKLLAEPGRPTSDLVGEADQVRAEEQRLLVGRVGAEHAVERNTRAVQWMGSILAFALLGLAVHALRRASVARKSAEDKVAQRTAELAASEAHFRSAFQDAGIGMALVALDGQFVQVNRSLCDIVGYPEAELRSKNFQGITHPDDLANDLGKVADLVEGRARTYQLEKRYFHRSGRVVWINLTVSLVHDAAGAPLHFISQIEDVTARRALETQLRAARDEALAASRVKSEFLATMSHEIRTPMNGVLGMAGLLAETTLDDDQREMIRVVQSSAESLLAVLDDILDLSKIEAGKLRLESADFDLRGLIDETVTLLGLRARQKGLELAQDIGPALAGYFRGDSGRVRQVLTNLVGNAIKFTESGAVTVTARLAREEAGAATVRVSVSDTGIGIPADAHGRLFRSFSQVDSSETRRFGGTGLGLAISRQLVTLMGGEIGFASEPGRGSTFWFELTMPRSAAVSPAPPPPAAPPMARSARILLVEDNSANQIVARRILERSGFTVVLAVDGTQAVEQASAAEFDAILMDCQMPLMDGFEATRRIRARERELGRRRAPIIALTAHALAEDRTRCADAGMDDYISKPLRAGELRALLQRWGLGGPAPG